MPAATGNQLGPNEITILARILGDEQGRLSVPMARHLLKVGFAAADEARMHDLTIRNQRDGLSPAEKDELIAYAKAGTLLSLLKAKARKTLRGKRAPRTSS